MYKVSHMYPPTVATAPVYTGQAGTATPSRWTAATEIQRLAHGHSINANPPSLSSLTQHQMRGHFAYYIW